MTDRPRVAIYLPALQIGGAQRVTINIANGLAARDFPVDLVVSFDEGGLANEVDEAISVVDLQTPAVPGLGIGASVHSLGAYLDRARPPVLIAAMTHANVVAMAARHLSNSETALVATEHNQFGVENTPKNRLVEFVAARAYRHVSRLVAVSEGVATTLAEQTGIDRDEVTVLYNPVDVTEIRRRAMEPLSHPWLDDDALDVVFTVGRLTPAKDIPTLLAAFERVHERRPMTRLIVAGRGEHREQLQEEAVGRGLSEIVAFPGYVDNPFAYMRGADAFALSSVHEGLPTVLVEALACGCPVVATDCPSGPREILEDGALGPLVPVADPEAFATATVDVLTDPTSPARLRDRADDFAMDRTIDRYADLVERVARDCRHGVADATTTTGIGLDRPDGE